MTESHKGGVIAVAAAVALVVGGISGYALGMNKSDDSSSNASMTQSAEKSSGADGVTVGGAKMVRTKDIVDNAAAASNVKTVVSLVQLAGLVDTLKGDGPFTVFGPNDDAFAKLDKATVESLQKPENVETLKKVLTYHVVAGTYTSADLKVMAQKGESLTTVQGEMLMPVVDGGMVKLKDVSGNLTEIETSDVISSNGVTHVIKSVLMPTM
jgi:uncharacterized surface protein with fasciclin (FAS1) repeats